MIDVEPLIRRELDAFVPAPGRERADWADVTRRAGSRASSPFLRRPLVLALGAAIAVLVSAVALAATLGRFDAWLSGDPGKPAPAGEQRRFEGLRGRSWASFPTGTELRELTRTRAGRGEYVLYGFRSGRSLCLRLVAFSFGKTMQSCAAAAALARISGPILVVNGDASLHARGHPVFPTAQVSFGIVADGVSRVDVQTIDGTYRARVGGNAYLFVEHEPNTGNRVLRISAVGRNGRRTTVTLPQSFGPFALEQTGARPRGPTRLEASIRNPGVRWHARGERRGVSPDEIRLTPEQRRELERAKTLGHLRLVKPDPLGDVVVGLAGDLCLLAFTSTEGVGMSCSPRRGFFGLGPLNFIISGGGGSEFVRVAGVAADGVARVTVFLADGQRVAAPLRHNLFAALVPGRAFPIRMVGYDRRGRVVAIVTPPPFRSGASVPAAARRLRVVQRAEAPNGAVAVLSVGPRVRGYHCWRVHAGGAPPVGTCVPPIGGGPKIAARVYPAGRDVFIVGDVHEVVSRVEVELEDGDVVSARPASGHFVVAVPRDHLRASRQRALVRGIDRQGHRVQRQGVVFRVP